MEHWRAIWWPIQEESKTWLRQNDLVWWNHLWGAVERWHAKWSWKAAKSEVCQDWSIPQQQVRKGLEIHIWQHGDRGLWWVPKVLTNQRWPKLQPVLPTKLICNESTEERRPEGKALQQSPIQRQESKERTISNERELRLLFACSAILKRPLQTGILQEPRQPLHPNENEREWPNIKLFEFLSTKSEEEIPKIAIRARQRGFAKIIKDFTFRYYLWRWKLPTRSKSAYIPKAANRAPQYLWEEGKSGIRWIYHRSINQS